MIKYSFVILTFNNIHFTERCLISLLDDLAKEGIKNGEFEILIYDQGSVDGIEELVEFYKGSGIKLHKLKEKSSFSAKNNVGAKDAKGEYIIFMNNDMEVLSDLILPMKEILETRPEIGIVGNKHYFPGMRLNHVGIAYIDKNVPHHLYPNDLDNKKIHNEGRVVPAVTAACIMVRRDEFLKIGGFDETYIYGYEDVDLCLKYKKELDKDCYFEPKSRLIHFGQSSYGRSDDEEKNRKYFEKKWGEEGFTSLFDIYNEDSKKFSNLIDKVSNKILSSPLQSEVLEGKIRSKYVIDYDKYKYDGNTVVFFYDEKFSAFNKVIMALHDAFARGFSEKYKVLVDQPENFSNYRYSDAITVIYDHFWEELFHGDREQSEKDFRFYAVNYENKGERLDYWTQHIVDCKFQLLAISEYCKEFLENAGVVKDRITVLHHGVKDEALQIIKEKGLREFDGTAKYLIVTNTNDSERYNSDMAIRAFAQAFASKKYKVELTVKDYGGSSHKVKELIAKELEGFNVNFISDFLTDYDLAMLYYNNDCMITPFRGEGFGMKIIDAMAVGEVIIAPDYGGPKDFLKLGAFLSLNYKTMPIGETADKRLLMLDEQYVDCMVEEKDLVKKLEQSLNEMNDLKERANRATKDIKDGFGWDQIAQKLDQILKDVPVDRSEKWDAKFVMEADLVVNPQIKPEFSLLVNSYNRPDNIEKLINHLNSLKDIKDIPTELVIVDDGSEKSYEALIKKCATSKELKVRYFRYTPNRGYVFPKNVALAVAEGKVAAFMGDDIYPLNGFIKRRYQRQIDNPKLLVLGHTEWHPDIRNNLIADFSVKQSDFQFGYESFRNDSVLEPYMFYTSNISFNIDAVRALGLRLDDMEGLTMMEDALWGIKLANHGFVTEYDRKIEALHNHSVDYDWFIKRAQNIGHSIIHIYLVYPQTQIFTGVESLLNEIRYYFKKGEDLQVEVSSEFIKDIEDNYREQVASLTKLFEESKSFRFRMEVRARLEQLMHRVNRHYLFKGLFSELGILQQCESLFLDNLYGVDTFNSEEKLLNKLERLRVRRVVKLGAKVVYGTTRDLISRRTKNIKGVLLENIRRVKDEL